MPLDEENSLPVSPVTKQFFSDPNPDVRSGTQRFVDQVTGAFTRENIVGSLLNYESPPDAYLPSSDPLRAALFNPDEYLTETEKLYGDRFTRANSPQDIDFIRKQIEGEEVVRQAVRSGPLAEWFVNTVASVADPTSLLPVAGPWLKGGRAASAAMSALTVGTSAAAGVAAQEGILQATQYTRTAEESVASILSGLVFGGVLGTVAGAALAKSSPKAAMTLHADLTGEATQVLRAAGLGDMPIPRGGLMDTTAVGRFLSTDVEPRWSIPRNETVVAADTDILNHISEVKPALVTNVTKAMADVEALGERISFLEADPALFVRPANIKDKATLDLIATLEKEGTPEALARVEQIKEGATPAVTLDRLYKQMDEATDAWQAAEDALAKQVAQTKEAFKELDAQFGPVEYAKANTDIANHYADLKAAIEVGKDPLKLHPTPNIMDWLNGIAQYPGREKAPKSMEPGGAKVDEEAVAKVAEEVAPQSLSAARADHLPTIGNRLRSTLGMAKLSAYFKKFGFAAPAVELAMSRFETSRLAIQKLANTGLTTNDHWAGARGPDDLATEVKVLGDPAIMNTEKILKAAWSDQKTAAKAGDVAPMSQLQFYQEIFNGSIASANPHAKKAADALKVIEKQFADLATEYGVGVFKDPEKAAANAAKSKRAWMRSWMSTKIEADPLGFKALVKDYITRTWKGNTNAILDAADDVADNIKFQILGMPADRLPSEIKVNVPEARGSTKARTFDIPDDWRTLDGKYSVADFTDRNIANVMARYIRTMSADIAYHKILGGDEGMEVIRNSLKAEATDQIKALGGEKDAALLKAIEGAENADDLEKATAKLDKKFGKQSTAIYRDLERELRVIEELTHRIRGTSPDRVNPGYEGIKRVSKMARDYNVIRVMGSAVASQLPDVGGTVMAEGLGRTFGTIFADMITGFRGMKIGIAEAQRGGNAIDMYSAGRMGQIADLSEQYTRQTNAEIISGQFAHKSLILFGVSPWTVAAKGYASLLGGDSILRGAKALAEGGKLSDSARARLAAAGIDEEMAVRIMAEQDNFHKQGNLLVSQAETWKDTGAADAFTRALTRRVDSSVISPTAADRPLWMQTELGKPLTQFQAFGWAAHQRILLAGLQYRDADILAGAVSMVGLGIMATVLRDIAGKGEVDKKRTTAQWIKEGVDRSGIVSRFMETDNLFDKLSGGHGLVRKLTGEEASRFAGTGALDRLLGPTGGLVSDLSKAGAGAITKDFTGADLHSIRRMGPWQNAIYFNYLLNRTEERLVDYYGLQPRQTPR